MLLLHWTNASPSSGSSAVTSMLNPSAATWFVLDPPVTVMLYRRATIAYPAAFPAASVIAVPYSDTRPPTGSATPIPSSKAMPSLA